MTEEHTGRPSSLRAAIIGLGVGEQHISGYHDDPRCKVVALCDIDKKRLEEVGSRHPGMRMTTSADELLCDPDIDVVSIASFDDVHHSQIISGIRHGKHLFVEKPLCLTRHQLNEISGALGQHPELKLSSNLILRRTPRFRELQQRIVAGDLGRIYYMEGDYDYGRINKLTAGWRSEIPGYSVVHGGGIHLVDLLLWLLGEKVDEVFAYGNQISTQSSSFTGEDMVVSLIRFRNGEVAKISSNFGSVTPHHHNVSIYGTSGTFVQNHLGAAYLWSRDPESAPEPVDARYPGARKGDMLAGFVGSILDGSKPEVSANEVFRAMDVSLAIVESLSVGEPVKVNNHEWWSE